MKKQLSYVIATIVAAGISIGLQATEIHNFEINETYKTARAMYHCLGDTTLGSDVDVYSVSNVTIEWPTRFGDNDVSALQDTLLRQVFLTHDTDVDAAIDQLSAHPLHDGEGTLIAVDSIPEGDNVLVLERNVSVSSVGFCDRFIVYRADFYINEGGVHPNYFSQYINYDIRDNRVLDFNDIFVVNADSALLQIVSDAMLQRFYATSLDELSSKADIYVDELFVSRDVYLTGNQIVFSYDPYEVAPWSTGVVEVPVYVDDLWDYLTPVVRSLYDED